MSQTNDGNTSMLKLALLRRPRLRVSTFLLPVSPHHAGLGIPWA